MYYSSTTMPKGIGYVKKPKIQKKKKKISVGHGALVP